jgi:hypothetical protein
MNPDSVLRVEYEKVKTTCSADYKGTDATRSIFELVAVSLAFLRRSCKPISLVSRVSNKKYFTFTNGTAIARPANKDLFVRSITTVRSLWRDWLADRISPEGFSMLSYTAALAPCLAMEIFDRQNKKGPATYFECYIGHLFAKTLGVNPTKAVKIPVQDRDVRMTMDFLIDVGSEHRKIHLPVKMSTRERVVQAWAHQRLLNAAYGERAYRGIMVLFSETKLDSKSLEVVEICVPDQWLAYQTYLAHMDRIYYFDMPERYRNLSALYPSVMAIKPFGEFFKEKDAVLYS